MITIQYVDNGLVRWARTYRMPTDGWLRTKHFEIDLSRGQDGDTFTPGWPAIDDRPIESLPLTWGEE